MPAFHTERSISIDAPVDAVRGLVRDLRKWPQWSPWLLAEPDAKLDFGPDGKWYSWDGRIVGKGSITLENGSPDRLGYTIRFLKPFRSTGTVGMHLAETDGGTEVTWTMRGTLPFFLFFMKPAMAAWIGADYRRGLLMLKDLAETGKILSRIEFQGIEPVAAIDYVGIRVRGSCSNIGPEMEKAFQKLAAWLEANSLAPTGPVFSIHRKWHPVRDVAEFTCAVSVSPPPAGLPDDFHAGTIPGGRSYVVLHTGAYRHLGNAWAAGIMRARAGIFRRRRNRPPIEIYRNRPDRTPEAELVTEIRIPVA